jgi:hypothetical protein
VALALLVAFLMVGLVEGEHDDLDGEPDEAVAERPRALVGRVRMGR